jgi:single-stranded DNA-binding protein
MQQFDGINTRSFSGFLSKKNIKDPLKTIKGFEGKETSAISFSIPANGGFKGKGQDVVRHPDWINCTAYGRDAETINAAHDGSGIHIEGDVFVEKYTDKKDGSERESKKVIVKKFFLFTRTQKDDKPAETQKSLPVADDDIPF